MNPDSSVGRILTAAEAEAYFEQVIAAEKAMGPITREERMVILNKFGSNISLEDLVELLKEKRVLKVEANDETSHNAGPEHRCPECQPKESQ